MTRSLAVFGKRGDPHQALVDQGRFDEAIDLYVTERDYGRAAEIASERLKDHKRAAQLWFRAGDFARAARARMENKEPMLAAELFERSGDYASAGSIYEKAEDFPRASILYEKAGDKQHAADLLVRALSGGTGRRMVGSEADEACRRAGVLYSEVGHLELAVRILRWGGQNVFAGKLLARAGKTDEAIDLLSKSGDYLAAAELARAAGNDRRAHLLLAERAEKEGHFAEAASHFEQAEQFVRAARLYEYAGELANAAEVYERSGQWESASELYEQLGRVTDAKRCLESAGRTAEAAALADRSDHEDDSIRSYVAAGELLRAARGLVTLARKGDRARYVEATQHLSRIAAEHRDYFEAKSLLAEVFAEEGDHRSALAVLQALLAGVKTSREHLPAMYQYGRMLELEGYLASARSAYQAVMQVDPAFRDVKDRLQLLSESDAPAPGVALRVPPVRTVTGVPIQAPRPRAMSEAHGIAVPVAPMVSGAPRVSSGPNKPVASAPMTSAGVSGSALSLAAPDATPVLLSSPFATPSPGSTPSNTPVYGGAIPSAPLTSAGLVAPSLPGASYPQPPPRRSSSVLGVPAIPPPPRPGSSPAVPVSQSGTFQVQVSQSGTFVVPNVSDLTLDAPPPPPRSASRIAAVGSNPALEAKPLESKPVEPPKPIAPVKPIEEAKPEPAKPAAAAAGAAAAAAAADAKDAKPESKLTAEVFLREAGLIDDEEQQAPSARPSSLQGIVLRGRFRIERRIGKGAQAHVYLARDLVLDRPVAIKVLNEVVAQDPQALDRFLREARLAARVHHASCIAIFDFGQERGITFMAMEYFKGKTLRDRLNHGPMPPAKALRIAREIADALGAVHTAGIVHRDVKPTNVMVDDAGSSRLTDFGVAKLVNEESTTTGVMVGTMKYMSPEQARGKDADRRSDIFSLGVVLFEMLAGAPPFGGTLDALIHRVTQPPPLLPPELKVPELVRTLVHRCMQRKPDARYQAVEPLIADLARCLDQLEDAATTDLPVMPPLPPPPGERPPETLDIVEDESHPTVGPDSDDPAPAAALPEDDSA